MKVKLLFLSTTIDMPARNQEGTKKNDTVLFTLTVTNTVTAFSKLL